MKGTKNKKYIDPAQKNLHKKNYMMYLCYSPSDKDTCKKIFNNDAGFCIALNDQGKEIPYTWATDYLENAERYVNKEHPHDGAKYTLVNEFRVVLNSKGKPTNQDKFKAWGFKPNPKLKWNQALKI